MSLKKELEKVAKAKFKGNIEVIDIAVFVKQEGMYSMYLLSRSSRKNYDVNNLFLILDNIEEIQYGCNDDKEKGMFLLKLEDSWTVIYPRSFSWLLNRERLDKRVKTLPVIRGYNLTHICNWKCLKGDIYAINIGGNKDLLVRQDEFHMTGKMTVQLQEFKNILPIDSVNEFQVRESMHETYICKCKDNGKTEITFGPAECIGDFPDYPVFNRHYKALKAVDKDWRIMGIYIICDHVERGRKFTYKIELDRPAKEFKFMHRIINERTEEWYDSTLPDSSIEFWKATYEDGTEEIIIQVAGKNYNVQFKGNFN